MKILNDVVRLHYLHKGKPIDVSKNIMMLRKANKERMESMEKIQFFDRKDLERVVDKLRTELQQVHEYFLICKNIFFWFLFRRII